MKTAQENIASLPAWCWGVLLTDNSLIRIKAGEQGYYPANEGTPQIALILGLSGKNSDEIADVLNTEKGVTRQQREAMEWGSQFGWHLPLADPDNYDAAGRPYCEANPRP